MVNDGERIFNFLIFGSLELFNKDDRTINPDMIAVESIKARESVKHKHTTLIIIATKNQNRSI